MTPHLVERLAALDTTRFTVEELAHVFNTWRWVARLLIKSCVRRGEFIRIDDEHYAVAD